MYDFYTMKQNIGSTDSIIRLVISVLATLLYLFNVIGTVTTIILLAFGILMFFTSLTRKCPIYSLFGLSTYKFGQKKA